MHPFKIGIISDWLKLPFRESMKKCAALGADGVQLYAVDGEMAPENMTPASIAEKRAIIQDILTLCRNPNPAHTLLAGRRFKKRREAA